MLRIFLFGSVRIENENTVRATRLTQTIQGLLVFLLLERKRMHSRDVLANLFWGDSSQERARSCLNTALWRLRRELEPEGTPNGTFLISNHQGEVGLNQTGAMWVDMEDFRSAANALLAQTVENVRPETVQRMEKAILLYTSDLLEGFFDEWAIRQRENLRLMFINALIFLVQYFKQQMDLEKSLMYARRILELDPLREEIHREVMRFHMAKGERAQALRQYETCRSLMQKELGIALMKETEILHHQILGENDPAAERTLIGSEGLDVSLLLQEISHLEERLDEVYHQFARVIRSIEQINHPK